MSQEKAITPLMRQYFEVKANYPSTILLFQVGDFYELFFDDATRAATVLGIALTSRGTHNGEPIPLCGVPLHVADLYVSKLVKAGFKVALCDQLEVAKPGKVVDRGVTRVLTPGTLTDSNLLDEKSASYLSVFFPTQTSWALLFAELLTGQLFVTLFASYPGGALEAELTRFMPDELLVPATKMGEQFQSILAQQGFSVWQEPYSVEHKQEALIWASQQFQQSLPASDALAGAVTILHRYLKKNNEQGLAELKHLTVYRPEDYVMLDAVTQRNLELVKNSHDGSVAHTLFGVLDRAVTPMGSRMLKKWLLRPLIKKEAIEERLAMVELFVYNNALKSELRGLLQRVGDLERIVGRIALKRAHLHDYQALLGALTVVPSVKKLLAGNELTLAEALAAKIADFSALEQLVSSAIHDDASVPRLVKAGFHEDLDRLRLLADRGAQEIYALELREQQRTGINSLKIRYNGVHGYGIEITNTHAHLVPADYLRIQTLANRERFTIQELKNLEHDLLRARNEILQVEKEVFESIKLQVQTFVPSLKKLSYALAYADALGALAQVAYTQRYVRPAFNDGHALHIKEGRHPVVEMRLHAGFIPNDLSLTDVESLWLITGPNMGGKSTFLRQVALITLMAHVGSFVPAAAADVPLVDRIFTRIGASDNVAEGKSTFLVEMEETAIICNQATAQSLVILDEVGRGTSTFDGLALAQSVVEYLHKELKVKCLFATHYHELTALSERYPGIKPYYAASSKTATGILLLHKILPGIADGSFGLEVAQLAQLPPSIVARAREILQELTQSPVTSNTASVLSDSVAVSSGVMMPSTGSPTQMALPMAESSMMVNAQAHQGNTDQSAILEREAVLASRLAAIDMNEITPKQALDLMWQLHEIARVES